MNLFKNIFWSIAKKNHNIEKQLHELKSLSVEITGSCNMFCQHCYMSATNDNGGDLSLAKWRDFFVQLKKDFGNKIIIKITGGEPLLRNDIFELLEIIHNLGFKKRYVPFWN